MEDQLQGVLGGLINSDTVAEKNTDDNALLISAIAAFGDFSAGQLLMKDDDQTRTVLTFEIRGFRSAGSVAIGATSSGPQIFGKLVSPQSSGGRAPRLVEGDRRVGLLQGPASRNSNQG